MLEKVKKLIDILVEIQNPDVRDKNGNRLSPQAHASWVYEKKLAAAELVKDVLEELFKKYVKGGK